MVDRLDQTQNLVPTGKLDVTGQVGTRSFLSGAKPLVNRGTIMGGGYQRLAGGNSASYLERTNARRESLGLKPLVPSDRYQQLLAARRPMMQDTTGLKPNQIIGSPEREQYLKKIIAEEDAAIRAAEEEARLGTIIRRTTSPSAIPGNLLKIVKPQNLKQVVGGTVQGATLGYVRPFEGQADTEEEQAVRKGFEFGGWMAPWLIGEAAVVQGLSALSKISPIARSAYNFARAAGATGFTASTGSGAARIFGTSSLKNTLKELAKVSPETRGLVAPSVAAAKSATTKQFLRLMGYETLVNSVLGLPIGILEKPPEGEDGSVPARLKRGVQYSVLGALATPPLMLGGRALGSAAGAFGKGFSRVMRRVLGRSAEEIIPKQLEEVTRLIGAFRKDKSMTDAEYLDLMRGYLVTDRLPEALSEEEALGFYKYILNFERNADGKLVPIARRTPVRASATKPIVKSETSTRSIVEYGDFKYTIPKPKTAEEIASSKILIENTAAKTTSEVSYSEAVKLLGDDLDILARRLSEISTEDVQGKINKELLSAISQRIETSKAPSESLTILVNAVRSNPELKFEDFIKTNRSLLTNAEQLSLILDREVKATILPKSNKLIEDVEKYKLRYVDLGDNNILVYGPRTLTGEEEIALAKSYSMFRDVSRAGDDTSPFLIDMSRLTGYEANDLERILTKPSTSRVIKPKQKIGTNRTALKQIFNVAKGVDVKGTIIPEVVVSKGARGKAKIIAENISKSIKRDTRERKVEETLKTMESYKAKKETLVEKKKNIENDITALNLKVNKTQEDKKVSQVLLDNLSKTNEELEKISKEEEVLVSGTIGKKVVDRGRRELEARNKELKAKISQYNYLKNKQSRGTIKPVERGILDSLELEIPKLKKENAAIEESLKKSGKLIESSSEAKLGNVQRIAEMKEGPYDPLNDKVNFLTKYVPERAPQVTFGGKALIGDRTVAATFYNSYAKGQRGVNIELLPSWNGERIKLSVIPDRTTIITKLDEIEKSIEVATSNLDKRVEEMLTPEYLTNLAKKSDDFMFTLMKSAKGTKAKDIPKVKLEANETIDLLSKYFPEDQIPQKILDVKAGREITYAKPTGEYISTDIKGLGTRNIPKAESLNITKEVKEALARDAKNVSERIKSVLKIRGATAKIDTSVAASDKLIPKDISLNQMYGYQAYLENLLRAVDVGEIEPGVSAVINKVSRRGAIKSKLTLYNDRLINKYGKGIQEYSGGRPRFSAEPMVTFTKDGITPIDYEGYIVYMTKLLDDSTKALKKSPEDAEHLLNSAIAMISKGGDLEQIETILRSAEASNTVANMTKLGKVNLLPTIEIELDWAKKSLKILKDAKGTADSFAAEARASGREALPDNFILEADRGQIASAIPGKQHKPVMSRLTDDIDLQDRNLAKRFEQEAKKKADIEANDSDLWDFYRGFDVETKKGNRRYLSVRSNVKDEKTGKIFSTGRLLYVGNEWANPGSNKFYVIEFTDGTIIKSSNVWDAGAKPMSEWYKNRPRFIKADEAKIKDNVKNIITLSSDDVYTPVMKGEKSMRVKDIKTIDDLEDTIVPVMTDKIVKEETINGLIKTPRETGVSMQHIKDENSIFAKKGEDTVGFVQYIIDNGVPKIKHIAVNKEFQRQGIGTELVNQLKKEFGLSESHVFETSPKSEVGEAFFRAIEGGKLAFSEAEATKIAELYPDTKIIIDYASSNPQSGYYEKLAKLYKDTTAMADKEAGKAQFGREVDDMIKEIKEIDEAWYNKSVSELIDQLFAPIIRKADTKKQLTSVSNEKAAMAAKESLDRTAKLVDELVIMAGDSSNIDDFIRRLGDIDRVGYDEAVRSMNIYGLGKKADNVIDLFEIVKDRFPTPEVVARETDDLAMAMDEPLTALIDYIREAKITTPKQLADSYKSMPEGLVRSAYVDVVDGNYKIFSGDTSIKKLEKLFGYLDVDTAKLDAASAEIAQNANAALNKLVNQLDVAVTRRAITKEDSEALKLFVSKLPPILQDRLSIVARDIDDMGAAGQLIIAKNQYQIQIGKNLSTRWSRPDIQPTVVFLHELGNLSHAVILTKEERAIVEAVFNKLGKQGRISLFKKGLSGESINGAIDRGAEYFANSPDEFFAQAFTEYVVDEINRGKFGPEMTSIFKKIFEFIQAAVDRVIGRDRPKVMEELNPLFEKIFKLETIPEKPDDKIITKIFRTIAPNIDGAASIEGSASNLRKLLERQKDMIDMQVEFMSDSKLIGESVQLMNQPLTRANPLKYALSREYVLRSFGLDPLAKPVFESFRMVREYVASRIAAIREVQKSIGYTARARAFDRAGLRTRREKLFNLSEKAYDVQLNAMRTGEITESEFRALMFHRELMTELAEGVGLKADQLVENYTTHVLDTMSKKLVESMAESRGVSVDKIISESEVIDELARIFNVEKNELTDVLLKKRKPSQYLKIRKDIFFAEEVALRIHGRYALLKEPLTYFTAAVNQLSSKVPPEIAAYLQSTVRLWHGYPTTTQSTLRAFDKLIENVEKKIPFLSKQEEILRDGIREIHILPRITKDTPILGKLFPSMVLGSLKVVKYWADLSFSIPYFTLNSTQFFMNVPPMLRGKPFANARDIVYGYTKMLQDIFRPSQWDYWRRRGVLPEIDDILDAEFGAGSISRLMNTVTTVSEFMNRVATAHTAELHYDRLFREGTLEKYYPELSKAFTTDMSGNVVLNRDIIREAATALSDMTQFRFGLENKPAMFRNPIANLYYQYSSFALKQAELVGGMMTKLASKDTWKEFQAARVNGNVAEFLEKLSYGEKGEFIRYILNASLLIGFLSSIGGSFFKTIGRSVEPPILEGFYKVANGLASGDQDQMKDGVIAMAIPPALQPLFRGQGERMVPLNNALKQTELIYKMLDEDEMIVMMSRDGIRQDRILNREQALKELLFGRSRTEEYEDRAAMYEDIQDINRLRTEAKDDEGLAARHIIDNYINGKSPEERSQGLADLASRGVLNEAVIDRMVDLMTEDALGIVAEDRLVRSVSTAEDKAELIFRQYSRMGREKWLAWVAHLIQADIIAGKTILELSKKLEAEGID